MLLSGVRSSCDMFARNSDLYFDVSASSAASSRARCACSTSLFFRSTSTFCSASCFALEASSSFVCCSSVLDAFGLMIPDRITRKQGERRGTIGGLAEHLVNRSLLGVDEGRQF